jgi:cytochrome b6-f complex iron-sulfur subunit
VTISLNDITENSAKVIRYNNIPTLIIHRKHDEIYALSAVCTHLGCIVKWDETKGLIVCPCHEAIFDLQGNILAGPAPLPLTSFPIKIAQEKIVIGEV